MKLAQKFMHKLNHFGKFHLVEEITSDDRFGHVKFRCGGSFPLVRTTVVDGTLKTTRNLCEECLNASLEIGDDDVHNAST